MVIFDLVVLALTTNRIFRGVDERTRSDFTKRIWESQIIYFLAVTATNISKPMLNKYPILHDILPLPFSSQFGILCEVQPLVQMYGVRDARDCHHCNLLGPSQ